MGVLTRTVSTIEIGFCVKGLLVSYNILLVAQVALGVIIGGLALDPSSGQLHIFWSFLV
jgi:hypothetical protein